MPFRRVADVVGVVEVSDSLGVATRHGTTVVHPAARLAEDGRFVHTAFAVGQRAASEVFGDVGGHANGQKTEVGLSQFERFGRGDECRLQLEKRFTVGTGADSRREVLLNQRSRFVAVEPSQSHGHQGLLVTVTVGQPLALSNPGIGGVGPEIDAEHLGMSEPDGSVMIVIGSPGVSHACQRVSRRAVERVKERSLGGGSEMPAGPLGGVDFH